MNGVLRSDCNDRGAGTVRRALSFRPPPAAIESAGPPEDEGWVSVGWVLLDDWRTKQGGLGYREFGKRLECSISLISGWNKGKAPSPAFQARLEAQCGVAAAAWSWWVRTEVAGSCLEAPRPAASPEPTPSKPRPPPEREREREGGSGGRQLGTNAEELRISVERLTRELDTAGLTPAQVATLEGRRVSALKELLRYESQRGIHEHPAFDGLLEDLIAAVVAELGPAAPHGIEGRIADRLEELQAARAGGAERRAA